MGTRGGNIILEKLICYGLGNNRALFLLKSSLYYNRCILIASKCMTCLHSDYNFMISDYIFSLGKNSINRNILQYKKFDHHKMSPLQIL